MARLRFLPRLRRSVYKKVLQYLFGDRHFITNYFGCCFLVRWRDVIGREIALQNYERQQLGYLLDACARVKPNIFIDIGANSGLYSCVLLKRDLVREAVLFEPDTRNRHYLHANLAINNLLDRAVCRGEAIAAGPGRLMLCPGPESNTGMSRVVTERGIADSYEVQAVALDGVLSISGKTIAMKLDVEGYELEALAGMRRTLRENRGIVQIETHRARAEVIEIMNDLGYRHVVDFFWDQVFEKP